MKGARMKVGVFIIILTMGASSSLMAEDMTRTGATEYATGNPKIPLQVTKDIKVAYQISDDKLKDSTNRALKYAKKLLDTYNAQEVPDEEIDLHLVFHGSSLTALVNSETRKRLKAEGGEPNPNVELINELLERGVSIEVCESSMSQVDIKPADFVSNEIATVVGAFPRLISLQHLGFAYIKFE
jgi:intracellular sulfur oxidation DsrE/DsrF family protein